MKIFIAGGSGFIGTELTKQLIKKGHRLIIASRHPSPALDPMVKTVSAEFTKPFSPGLLEDSDAAINLTGKNIFGRFTRQHKEDVYQSRVLSTKNIAAATAANGHPKIFINASAVGIYGERGAETLTEDSHPGSTFLARLCLDWEAAASLPETSEVRCVQIRTAQVLGKGGLLAEQLPYFKFFLGTTLGTGKQYMPWIHIRDLVEAYIFALENSGISGPVNVSSPHYVTNQEFSEKLAKVLNRPLWFRVPKFALQLVFGEFAQEILASEKVVPKKILSKNFKFIYPELDAALENILKK